MDELPFYDRFIEPIKEGRKTMTARTKIYGEPGDVLDTPVGPVEIIRVIKAKLHVIKSYYYFLEGFESPADFVKCWEEIHPRKGYQPDWEVWLHQFRYVGDDTDGD